MIKGKKYKLQFIGDAGDAGTRASGGSLFEKSSAKTSLILGPFRVA